MKFTKEKNYITKEGMPIEMNNSTTKAVEGKFYISYNPKTPTRDSYKETTCIVVQNKYNSLFLSLEGDHRKYFENMSSVSSSLSLCIDYYIKNITKASSNSEHNLLLREDKLVGIPSKDEIKVLLGEENFKLLEEALV